MIELNKIIFPTDFSRCADQALPHAVFLAKQYGAELHMLHAVVLHEDDPHNPAYHFPNIDEINQMLNQLITADMKDVLKKYDAEELKTTQVQRWGVSTAPLILEYAVVNDIDLIVMGTHGKRGLGHFFLGSVAEEVVRMAPCPVLTVREREKEAPLEAIENIMVPVDFSEHSKQALEYAKEIASIYKSKLQLLHVIEETVHPSFYVSGQTSIFEIMPDIEMKSKEAMNWLLEESHGPEVQATVEVVEGRTASEIVKYTKQNATDLVVIATHGLTGLEHMLIGSVAEKVVRLSPCPVFTVKSLGKSLLKP